MYGLHFELSRQAAPVLVTSGHRHLYLWRAQTAQHIPHHLRPRFRVGQFAFDADFVVARQLDVFVLLDQADDGHGLHRRVGLEGDLDHARGGVDLDDAIGLGQHAQAVHIYQRLRLRGQFAKAVDQLFEQGVDLVAGQVR